MQSKESIRELYKSYNKVFTPILAKISSKISKDLALNPKPVLKARVKSFNSYYSKILRVKSNEVFKSEGLVCLTDMIGIRVVCAFLEDISTVEKIIKENYDVKEIEYKGQNQSFREFGYESTHVLISIPSDCIDVDEIGEENLKKYPLPEELVCEIQIRTILQDAWAEVEHELIYKTEFTPFDAPLRRKLASVNASLSLADIIFQEIRDYQKNLQDEVDQRRESFYEQVDFVTDAENNLSGKKHSDSKDLNRVSPYVHGTIDDMILAAIRAHNEGNLDEAVEIYTKIISADSQMNETVLSVIHKHRGMAYFAQGNYEGAMKDFSLSEKYGKDNFRAIYYQGIVYGVQGDNQKAVECFTRSLDINEFQSHAFFRRALSYYNLNDFQNALKDMNSASRLGLDSDEFKEFKEKLMKKFDMNM